MESTIKKGRQARMEKVMLISDRLEKSNGLVVNDYRGLTVSQISDLRREISQLGAEIHVQKNKLMKIALADKQYPVEINELFEGPTAVAYVEGEIAPVLKALFKYAKDEGNTLDVKGAYADGLVMDRASAEQVSKLPSREELLGILMGTMQAPVRNMAVGLNDIVARLARVLQAVADSK